MFSNRPKAFSHFFWSNLCLIYEKDKEWSGSCCCSCTINILTIVLFGSLCCSVWAPLFSNDACACSITWSTDCKDWAGVAAVGWFGSHFLRIVVRLAWWLFLSWLIGISGWIARMFAGWIFLVDSSSAHAQADFFCRVVAIFGDFHFLHWLGFTDPSFPGAFPSFGWITIRWRNKFWNEFRLFYPQHSSDNLDRASKALTLGDLSLGSSFDLW